MSRHAVPIELGAREETTLTTWGRRRTLPLRQVQRAQIVQLAAAGVDSQDIAATLGVSRPTVQLWRQWFLTLRIGGLEHDAPRPGRLAQITESQVQAVLAATLDTTPPNATRWSTRTMARAQSLGEATRKVGRNRYARIKATQQHPLVGVDSRFIDAVILGQQAR